MKLLFKISFVLLLVVIEFLATTTHSIPVVHSIWDKAKHFSAFFVLYFVLSMAFVQLRVWYRMALLLFFGIQIEIVQSFISGREASLLDVVADSLGIVAGYCMYHCVFERLYKRIRA